MLSKPRYLIGIDPGTKTGFAVWDRHEKRFHSVETKTIISAINSIRITVIDMETEVELRIEDARKRKWFGSAGKERLKGVGSVNRDCSIWQEFCEYFGIKYTLVAPKDTITKVSKEYFKKVSKWEGRTSEHSRDAGMLVIGG